MINKIIKFLPIGSLIFIVLGYLKIKYYYLCFGIDIVGFISISDIINLFLNDSISICISLIAPIYILIENLIPDDNIEINEERIREDERIKVYKEVIGDFKEIMDKLPMNDEKVSKVKSEKKHSYFSLVITILLIIALIVLINLEQNLIIISLYYPFATFLPVFIIKSLDNTKYEITKYYVESIFVMSLIMIFSINIYNEYFKVINNLKYKEISIETDSEIIKMDSNQLIIGNTEKYYFIKNKINNENLIINIDQIKKIKFIKSKEYKAK